MRCDRCTLRGQIKRYALEGRPRAFSLVEVLVVLAIITGLIAMIGVSGTRAKRQAKEFQARTMIAAIESALAMYHVDFGEYPPDTVSLIRLLAYAGDAGNPQPWNGPYISFKSEDLDADLSSARNILDPWGSVYHYIREPAGSVPPYRIWSNGPNRLNENGSGDDIRSW